MGSAIHFADPFKGACQGDEFNISVQSVAGRFCSPTCSLTVDCPKDLPDGITASPECVLQDKYSGHMCALLCSPGSNECGAQASCKPISGTGICTYDN